MRKFIYCLFAVKIILFAVSCANIVAPTGGDRDTTPPVVLKSNPPNFSTNFTDKRVRFYFDEYVELKNINQKLIISPPLETQPEFRLRGKSLIMELNPEELKPNTTYNIFFDDAVVDLNEGNAIPNFRFVFSTGDYLDSLSVKGTVIDAFSLKPEKDIYVMLYDSIYDSVPYLEKPTYVAKTNEKGEYEINFIREGEYKIFALQDINSSYTFDMPTEKIAFLDSVVIPEFLGYKYFIEKGKDETLNVLDTVSIDASENAQEQRSGRRIKVESDSIDLNTLKNDINDSTAVDSTVLEIKLPSYKLLLFQEEDTVQKIASSALIQKNVILMTFRVKADTILFRDIRKPIDETEFFYEFGKNKDSLTIWLNNLDRDSLFLEISDNKAIIDTVELSLEFKERPQRGRATSPEVKKIVFKNNLIAGGTLAYFEQLSLLTNNPIQTFDNQCFKLWENDTIPLDVSFEKQGITGRKLVMNFESKAETTYKLIIPDSCITDIYGISHDTLKINFRTDSEENYGKIIMSITLPKNEMQYILQLVDDKSEMVREMIINSSGLYSFPNLKAGKYSFKLIEDSNRDGKWTPGLYLKNIQPEKVFLFKEHIQLRENWEMESEWKLEIE
jgi:hypothetical protein